MHAARHSPTCRTDAFFCAVFCYSAFTAARHDQQRREPATPGTSNAGNQQRRPQQRREPACAMSMPPRRRYPETGDAGSPRRIAAGAGSVCALAAPKDRRDRAGKRPCLGRGCCKARGLVAHGEGSDTARRWPGRCVCAVREGGRGSVRRSGASGMVPEE